MDRPSLPPALPAGFLIAQVGGHAAAGFAEALKPQGFAPHDAGILRLLAMSPGISQQEIARRLGMHASRLVGVLDELGRRGLIERRPSAKDRRFYELHLTGQGGQALAAIGRVAREHQERLLASLNAEERALLTEMLARIARQQGLSPGVHPGYKKLGNEDE
ncbi:MAG: MarR family transcriptional regulator [Acidobacteria bacterium]|nr:MarR family transcriptional regulator [Acidobacteriota bacterium]